MSRNIPPSDVCQVGTRYLCQPGICTCARLAHLLSLLSYVLSYK